MYATYLKKKRFLISILWVKGEGGGKKIRKFVLTDSWRKYLSDAG